MRDMPQSGMSPFPPQKTTMKKNLLFLLFLFGIIGGCSSNTAQSDPEESQDPSSETLRPDLASVRQHLVDKNATEETAALFYNLKTLSKTRYLIGVHENETIMNRAGDVSEALYGTDFMFITDYLRNTGSWYKNKQTEIRDKIKAQYRAGQVIAMCWHYRNPILGEPDNFYWSSLLQENPDQENIVPRLIPGGSQHDRLKASLDILADFANSLIDDNGKKIPVLFRPWHEQSGDWFWWGTPHHCTQDEYRQLWKFTVEYLRDIKGVHNFLYVYSPNGNTDDENTYLNTYGYPGDDYVDVLGVDYYLTNVTTGKDRTQAQLKLIAEIAAKKQKIAAYTETGYDSGKYPVQRLLFTETYAPMIGDTQIAYMMFWSSENYIPSESYMSFYSYVRSPRVVTSINCPDMFTFPTP